MPRGDHTFVISLIASLLAHAMLLATMIPRTSPPPPIAPVIARPTPAAIFIDDSKDASMGFGDPTGSGDAANSSPGETPMAGRDADQTQAFLSRDPQGPGRVGDDPSMSVLPQTSAAAPTPPSAAAMLGVTSDATEIAPPKSPSPQLPGRDATSLTRTKNSPTAAPESQSEGTTAGSSLPAADPAVMSDSESDPFAPGKSVEFKDGKVDARLGRKVKTVRPQLNLAARYDLQTTIDPSITVRLDIDAEGAVRKVEIVKSSGSIGADQAVENALYQWWFEPKRDEKGNAVPSQITFPIHWR